MQEAIREDKELYEQSKNCSWEIYEEKNDDEFTILVNAPILSGKGQKGYVTFYIGRLFYPEMTGDEYGKNSRHPIVPDIKDGLFSFFVKGDSVYVDFSNIEVKKLNESLEDDPLLRRVRQKYEDGE